MFESGITYLFGAGASANTLPVVEKMPESMQKVIEKISTSEFDLSSHSFSADSVPSPETMRQDIIEQLTWLKQESEKHASVDTFAKKLFLMKKEKELDALRNILSLYLTLVQLDKPYDKRYDTFFASILQDEVDKFPSNIKIMSWNYDYQFERAYLEYKEKPGLIEIWNSMQLHDKYHNKQNFSQFGFEIIKLNGTAQVYDQSRKKFFHYATKENVNEPDRFIFYTSLDPVSFYQTVYWYTRVKYTSGFTSTLHFAWERGESFIQNVRTALAATNTLVIIGYSFPFFNRLVDRSIIHSLQSLNKVYFQDLYPEDVMQRFQSIKNQFQPSNNNVILYKDCKQFLLPGEL